MKQLVIFAGLGPLLGAAATAIVVLPVLHLLEGYEINTIDLIWPLKILWVVYIVGIIPALMTGLVDWRLRHVRFRIVLTVIAGALCSVPALWMFVLFPIWKKLPIIIVVGGIPAGVCSWLASRWKPDALQ